jgi:hypothetical protein
MGIPELKELGRNFGLLVGGVEDKSEGSEREVREAIVGLVN